MSLKKTGKKPVFWRLLWWIYLLCLFVLVVVKFNGSFSALKDRIAFYSSPDVIRYNLIPFRSLALQLRHLNAYWAVRNLLGNIIPFIPFGFLMPKAFGKIKTFGKVWAVSAPVIVGIELFQYLTRLGSLDIDDFILNMTAVAIGYGFQKAFRHRNLG